MNKYVIQSYYSVAFKMKAYLGAWTDKYCQRQRKCVVGPQYASCLCRPPPLLGHTQGATCRGSQWHRKVQSRSRMSLFLFRSYIKHFFFRFFLIFSGIALLLFSNSPTKIVVATTNSCFSPSCVNFSFLLFLFLLPVQQHFAHIDWSTPRWH